MKGAAGTPVWFTHLLGAPRVPCSRCWEHSCEQETELLLTDCQSFAIPTGQCLHWAGHNQCRWRRPLVLAPPTAVTAVPFTAHPAAFVRCTSEKG